MKGGFDPNRSSYDRTMAEFDDLFQDVLPNFQVEDEDGRIVNDGGEEPDIQT